jgi:predicted rRNA methylase YqxC with S4 and FtsJ domains
MGDRRPTFRNVLEVVARARPDATDISRALTEGRILIDGRVITNPNALVRASASIRLVPRRRPRGEATLRFALERFDVTVDGRVALDVGAVDLSYLAIAAAVPQLSRLRFRRGADLLALVKPTFGLGSPTLAADPSDLARATRCAAEGVEQSGWTPPRYRSRVSSTPGGSREGAR